MRLADKADMPKIVEIWRQSFGDTTEEIQGFFNAFSDNVQTFLEEEEGQIAGQLCLLPISIHFPNKNSRPLFYIYAVATAGAQRGRGICTRLLSETVRWLKKEKKGALLVPAEESLVSFYEKRAFTCLFPKKEISVKASENKPCEGIPVLEPIDAAEYQRLRKKGFENAFYVELPGAYLNYAISQHKNAGGSLARLSFDNKEYGVLYTLPDGAEGTAVSIQEITAPEDGEAVCAARALLFTLSKREAILKRSYPVMGVELPDFACKDGYFNLVLD